MNKIPDSELILNNDGSVYHLHLLPTDLADFIITVGDPERVEKIAKHFDKILIKKRNREFYTITGTYKFKHITVISTGIGTDNIDIVFNELNILSSIDLEKRERLATPRKLTIIRLGTSGTLCEDIPIDTMLVSEYAIGLEGLMNFYPINYSKFESDYQKIVMNSLQNKFSFLTPYIVSSSTLLNEKLGEGMLLGTTATCQGFYHPQGRFLWSDKNDSILTALKTISFEGNRVTNFEMETSGILGLARYFGHEATSISLILANRITNEFSINAEARMEEMIELCLERLLVC
jgi:uridine phosphorylase